MAQIWALPPAVTELPEYLAVPTDGGSEDGPWRDPQGPCLYIYTHKHGYDCMCVYLSTYICRDREGERERELVFLQEAGKFGA